MQIKIKQLLQILRKISGSTNKTKTQILLHVLIKIIENKIFCISVNEEIEIVTCDNIKNNKTNLEILIKYDLIYNICRSHNLESIIYINKSNNMLELKVENSIFKLSQKNTDTFPTYSTNQNILAKIKIKTEILTKLLSKAATTLSENNPKLFLTGILFQTNKNKLNVISSDGNRLFYSSIIVKNCNIITQAIIPKKPANEIINTFKNESDTIILITQNQIKFITKGITITSKLINDEYHYPKIKLSTNQNNKIKIKTLDFQNALKKISAVCTNKSKINIDIKNNHIKIETNNKNENVIINIKNETNIIETNISINFISLFSIIKNIDSKIFEIITIKKSKNLIVNEGNINCFYIITPLNK